MVSSLKSHIFTIDSLSCEFHLTSSLPFHVYNKKISLNEIAALTIDISGGKNLYLLNLSRNDCQATANLIKDYLPNDLDALRQLPQKNIHMMTKIQSLKFLKSSINCLMLIIANIGHLTLLDTE